MNAKRKYGCPTIYGGREDCEHEWQQLPEDKCQCRAGPGSTVSRRSTDASGFDIPHGSTCLKCGAWRGEMGLEPSIESYLAHLWSVFDEVWRCLRKDGVVFCNLGDSYGGGTPGAGGSRESQVTGGGKASEGRWFEGGTRVNYRAKSLLLIPERFILGMTDPSLRPALSKGLAPAVDHAWIARNKNVWHKKNPMPESDPTRFSCTWEPVFYFAKSNKTNTT